MGLFDTFKMSCRDATYLHGKQKEGKLSFSEMIGLRIHLLYCGLCRLFFKQLDVLEQQSKVIGNSEKQSPGCSAAAKEKMQQAIAQELKK
jgi:hypothetical protein